MADPTQNLCFADFLTGNRLQDEMRLIYVATRIDPRFEVIGFRPEQFRAEHPLAWEVKTRAILVQ